VGNTLHIIPAYALKQDTGAKGFTVSINKAQWALTPTLNEDRYEKDRIASLSDQDQKKLADLFKSSGMSSSSMNASSSTMLVRASEIRGKKIDAASGGKVGNIENVLVDLNDCSSGALVDPNKDFTGSDQKYVVPVSKLQFSSAEQDPVRTSVTRADFQNAKPAQMNTVGMSE
jgi:sporulation protein YlmC with PRC-barrel domain